MTQPYGLRVQRAVAERGALCVGIDPHPSILRAWGLDADVAGLERCARTMVAALGEVVAVFKPQSAFFEAYGSAGVAVLERTLADIAGTAALSLLDVKRGDIGSTMDAYAAAYLADGSALAADAVTLSPYLGFGSLDGAIQLARQTGRGVYVLAHTSNPEAGQVQLAADATGRSIAQQIIDSAAEHNAAEHNAAEHNAAEHNAAEHNAGDHLGSVGLVVGATIGRTNLDFSALNGSILAPGFGAQGGTVEDLHAVFGPALTAVLPSSSREVMAAGPDPASIRAAAEATLGRLAARRVG